MITLINYADSNMTISQQKNKISAIRHGAGQVVCYHPGMVSEPLRSNTRIFNNPRGCGLWSWKADIICDMMASMPLNSHLIYSDAGIEWVNNVRWIIDRMDEDIFFFTNTFKQVEWCRHEVMDGVLTEWRDGRYDNNMQVQASVIFFRVCPETFAFVREWRRLCMIPEFIEPTGKRDLDFPTYADHREDQSILTALQIKHGYKLHWYPSTTGHHVHHHNPNDLYPALFSHHRKRNNEW